MFIDHMTGLTGLIGALAAGTLGLFVFERKRMPSPVLVSIEKVPKGATS